MAVKYTITDSSNVENVSAYEAENLIIHGILTFSLILMKPKSYWKFKIFGKVEKVYHY